MACKPMYVPFELPQPVMLYLPKLGVVQRALKVFASQSHMSEILYENLR